MRESRYRPHPHIDHRTQQSKPPHGQRRFTGLTNAFGRKWENQWAAVVVWYRYYNFCRADKSLRVTPATEAGITDRIWELPELLA